LKFIIFSFFLIFCRVSQAQETINYESLKGEDALDIVSKLQGIVYLDSNIVYDFAPNVLNELLLNSESEEHYTEQATIQLLALYAEAISLLEKKNLYLKEKLLQQDVYIKNLEILINNSAKDLQYQINIIQSEIQP